MPRKRKRRSWGSITTVTKTKHVIRWMENTPEGRKRRSRTFCGTYKEACFELSRLQVEHSDDRPVPTIGDACRMWYLPWLERRIAERKTKARTGEIYTKCWERIIEPRWGSTPMDSVVPSDVQKWLLGLTAGNAEIALVVLRKIADFAVQYDVIDSNKFRLPYEIPAEKARGKRTGTYTLREATDLFEALRDHLTEASYILACFGSARTGESLGVRPAEVSLVESHGIKLAIAPISRRMDETGDLPLPDGDLKNPQSERTLVIPEPYGTRLSRNRRHAHFRWRRMVGRQRRRAAVQQGDAEISRGRRMPGPTPSRSPTCGRHGAPSRNTNGAWTSTRWKSSWDTSCRGSRASIT